MRHRLALPALTMTALLALGACSSSDHGAMDMGDGGGMGGSTMPHGDMGGSGPGPMGTTGTTTISVPADATFNETDVAFAQGMIPHHGQAVTMADMALEVSTDPAVRTLAEKIKAAQAPEIATMQGWLRAWGQAVPEPDQPMAHGSDGMGGMMMEGMMSEADMAELGGMGGADFDRMFLEMMVEHHEGAVAMAQTELAEGKDQAAKDLAQAIITAQQAEIAEMNQLLATTG